MTFPEGIDLTKRESDVLSLIARGKTTKEIANDLSIGAATVGNYRKALCSKLRAHSTAELVSKAAAICSAENTDDGNNF